MRTLILGGLILLLHLTPGYAGASAEDGLPDAASAPALLARAYENLYGHDFVQTLRMSTRFEGGRVTTRRLQITRKQSAPPGKALVRFLEPGDVRGTSVLLIENPDRYDDIYLYLPAFQIVRHLAVSQRSDAFFGTDVTYEDLEPKTPADYTVKSLGPGRAGDLPCTRIETRPRDGVQSAYDRVVSCIESARSLILWSEFYETGEVWKRLQVDPKSVHSVGGSWIPWKARIETPRRGTQTVLEIESYELRSAIPDTVFSATHLQFGDARSDRASSHPDE